jgi:hypothetical protein
MQNMRDFPTENPLVLFSDEYEGANVIKLGGSVEIAKVPTNRMAVNNLVFLLAIRIAATKGFTHILLVENDCRVNKAGWDKIIFDEFFRKNPDAICGGSLAIFNPCSYNHEASHAFEKFMFDAYPTRPVPLSITGSSNLAEHRDSCVFPNGALAVYQMEWLMKKFPEITQDTEHYVKVAQQIKTWDYEIGSRLWDEFKQDTYKKVVHFDCIYSGYGNVMTSEDQRKELLNSERVVAIHQIKSDWIPVCPEPAAKNIPLEAVPENLENMQPKMELFMVTYAKDFPYLELCLKSVALFCKGFTGLTILVPQQDLTELETLVAKLIPTSRVKCFGAKEWKNKGMLWHMAQICRADEWCKADYIAHFDPDCIFTKLVTPSTFFYQGRPLLRYEPFETLSRREPNIWHWKVACERCLPFPVPNEGMRGHPEVYHRSVYAETRKLVAEKTGKSFDAYVKSCENTFPQTFAEFPTLSAVALEKFPDLHSPDDCSKQENPDKSPWPVIQFWSHAPKDQKQTCWIDGARVEVIPQDIADQILK